MNLTDQPYTLGVIGGGQLCRMMAEAAGPLGVDIVFLDPTPNAPARSVARKQVVGDFDDKRALRRLLNYTDYLTYDIELANPDRIEALDPEQPVHPHTNTLRTIQDKHRQKGTLQEEGIPVPAFRSVDTPEELRSAGEEFGYPLMVKSRYGGYDGRGNQPLHDAENAAEVFHELEGPLMVEEFVPYDRELAVMGIKNSEEIRTYPPTQTVHEEEILRHTRAPADISDAIKEKARTVARIALTVLEGRGAYGIELFQDGEDILLNEIAPRPHNSGHWTIEGAVTSQFENHVRGVLDLPLGSTEPIEPSVTVNILGTEGERPVQLHGVDAILEHPKAHLHWYGKKQERPLRKLGHFTLTGTDLNEILEEAQNLAGELTFKS
jgi:5-(carboxyamino)imidazole ribonucleotide synthase